MCFLWYCDLMFFALVTKSVDNIVSRLGSGTYAASGRTSSLIGIYCRQRSSPSVNVSIGVLPLQCLPWLVLSLSYSFMNVSRSVWISSSVVYWMQLDKIHQELFGWVAPCTHCKWNEITSIYPYQSAQPTSTENLRASWVSDLWCRPWNEICRIVDWRQPWPS